MDNERRNDIGGVGGETLNDRLRRAAAMRAQQEGRPQTPATPSEPARQQPAVEQPLPPEPQVAQQQPVNPSPEPRRQPADDTPRREEPVRERPHRYHPEEEYVIEEPHRQSDSKKLAKRFTLLAVGLGAAVLAIVFLLFRDHQQRTEAAQQIEQLQLANEQLQLSNEYDALNNEFAQYENQTSLLANDSIVQKYSAARAQVEKLLQELQNEKNKSAAQISKLKDEIATLKGILRNYVEQINQLNQENQELRTENQQVKAKNEQLSQNIRNVTQDNKVLNERMTLAEKLNVTGVNLVPLNKKGKTEKNVTKARQLMVTFTIPQNNSTPVGEKVIYLRITNPEGDLLGNSGSFSFEGSTVPCTARKTIEYAGEEIGGVTMYWDVNMTLTPGDYTVELFCDNYRLASRRFTLKK